MTDHYAIDGEAISEIHDVITLLQNHICWLLERNDLASAGKLLSVTKHLQALILSVYCGNDHEMESILAPIEQHGTELFEKWRNAPTQERKTS